MLVGFWLKSLKFLEKVFVEINFYLTANSVFGAHVNTQRYIK